jgi:hypothetical protein
MALPRGPSLFSHSLPHLVLENPAHIVISNK